MSCNYILCSWTLKSPSRDVLNKMYVCMYRRIHFPHEQNIVSPSMTSQANSPHSSLMLGHGARKRPKLGTLKNHKKLTKIARAIIFSQRWSKRQKDLYRRKKILGVSCTLRSFPCFALRILTAHNLWRHYHALVHTLIENMENLSWYWALSIEK